jgi:hypothetical protein
VRKGLGHQTEYSGAILCTFHFRGFF